MLAGFSVMAIKWAWHPA